MQADCHLFSFPSDDDGDADAADADDDDDDDDLDDEVSRDVPNLVSSLSSSSILKHLRVRSVDEASSLSMLLEVSGAMESRWCLAANGTGKNTARADGRCCSLKWDAEVVASGLGSSLSSDGDDEATDILCWSLVTLF